MHLLRRQQGFTLMEITISLVLLGILGIAGAKMMAGSFYTTQIIGSGHLSNSTARYAMERMARDIREIQYNVSNVNNELQILTMTPSQVSFIRSGLNNTTTTIGFSYANPNLTMTVGSTSATLASNITGLTFTYLDANGAGTVLPQSVRYVRIAFTATPTQGQSISLITQVKLRNV